MYVGRYIYLYDDGGVRRGRGVQHSEREVRVVKAMTQIPQICSRMSCYVGESCWLLINKFQDFEIYLTLHYIQCNVHS